MRFPTRTIEIECIVPADAKISYRIAGEVQKAGDRARLPIVDARDLERRNKARIIEGSEKTELL